MSRTEPLAFSPLPQPLPSLEEVLEDAAVVDLPMTSRFRGLQRRESMLVRGPQGWAEFAAPQRQAPALPQPSAVTPAEPDLGDLTPGARNCCCLSIPPSARPSGPR